MLAKLLMLGALVAVIAVPAAQAVPQNAQLCLDPPQTYYPREVEGVLNQPKPSVCSWLEPQPLGGPVSPITDELPVFYCIQLYPYSMVCQVTSLVQAPIEVGATLVPSIFG